MFFPISHFSPKRRFNTRMTRFLRKKQTLDVLCFFGILPYPCFLLIFDGNSLAGLAAFYADCFPLKPGDFVVPELVVCAFSQKNPRPVGAVFLAPDAAEGRNLLYGVVGNFQFPAGLYVNSRVLSVFHGIMIHGAIFPPFDVHSLPFEVLEIIVPHDYVCVGIFFRPHF